MMHTTCFSKEKKYPLSIERPLFVCIPEHTRKKNNLYCIYYAFPSRISALGRYSSYNVRKRQTTS
jgi:hypothetical protein